MSPNGPHAPEATATGSVAARASFRLHALLCAVAFLACELLARPFAEMPVCDDWSYFKSAQVLAATGRIVYNGWATAVVGWQLYPAAALIQHFGASYTTVRAFTLFIATLTAFLLQRVLVRAGIGERNACLGTLALVLTPLYMELSATFMTDIPGLFAVVLCLYACIRALQAPSANAAAAWVAFAALSNALTGSSRQIAWLGVLVMVPCTLWLLRKQRRALLWGGLATLAGWAFVGFCLLWFARQPYAVPEHIFSAIHGLHSVAYMVDELLRFTFEFPFLILPLFLAFLPELRRHGRRFPALLGGLALVLLLLARVLMKSHGPNVLLEPLLGDWIGTPGFYDDSFLATKPPVILGTPVRVLLTALSLTGFACVVAFLLRLRSVPTPAKQLDSDSRPTLSWPQIGWLTGPFAATYIALLLPRSANKLLDRYLLTLLIVGVLCLVRAYQDFIHPRLPNSVVLGVALIALFSVLNLHDMFSFYRARLALTDELQAAGVAPAQLDGGWEYNAVVEVATTGHINDETIVNPPNTFIQVDPHSSWSCDGTKDAEIGEPHFHPRLGIAFSPDACAGPTSFAPQSYFRWLGLTTTKLYAVKYQPYQATAAPGRH